MRACMNAGLVKGGAFAVDTSVMEADASRYHAKAPDDIDWSLPERQTRAVAEFLGALDDEDPDADRKLPKAISPVDPCSAWTAKTNKRVQFGYELNYLIDIANTVIVDVEATPARLSLKPVTRLVTTTVDVQALASVSSSLAHGIRGRPRRSRQGVQLHRNQTWPPRWSDVC